MPCSRACQKQDFRDWLSPQCVSTEWAESGLLNYCPQIKSCVSCDRKTCHLLSSHGAHLSGFQSYFNQQKNSDKLHVLNNQTKNNETNTVPIKYLNMLCHSLSLSPPPDITLTHSLSLSARGVLTTVTQPAQLWSVGKAFSGRKWCVSISVCVCVRHTSACLFAAGSHTPLSFCQSGCSVCIVSELDTLGTLTQIWTRPELPS